MLLYYQCQNNFLRKTLKIECFSPILTFFREIWFKNDTNTTINLSLALISLLHFVLTCFVVVKSQHFTPNSRNLSLNLTFLRKVWAKSSAKLRNSPTFIGLVKAQLKVKSEINQWESCSKIDSQSKNVLFKT